MFKYYIADENVPVISSVNFFDKQEKSHKSQQLFLSNSNEPGGILPCIFVYTEEVYRNTIDKFQKKTKIKTFLLNIFFILLKQHFIKTTKFYKMFPPFHSDILPQEKNPPHYHKNVFIP